MSQLQQENVRYDRQIRLWGEEGQSSIKEASICVFGSSSLCSEILKNLVLAGFGSFHIVDDAVIGQTDLGQNFFITESDVGKPRAEVVVQNLLELNPSVRGSCSLVSFAKFDLENLLNYSLVVSTNLTEKKAEQLGDFLFDKNVYYIHTRVCGMFGYLRLCYKQHAVWDSHTENPSHDFRLTKEFTELSQFAASMDLDAMNHEKHSHTPYLVLYIKALEKWKAMAGEEANASSLVNYQKRKEFEKILMGMRKPDSNGSLDEENFHEGRNNLIKTFCRNDLSEGVRKVLADPKSSGTNMELMSKQSEDLNQFLRPFWVFAAAAHVFLDRHQHLPISGHLPDMTSDTARYTGLSQIYRQKATDEATELFEIAKTIYEERRNLIMQISARKFPASTNVTMPSVSSTNEGFLMSNSSSSDIQDETSSDLDMDQSDEVYLEMESANSNYSLSWKQCQQFCKNVSKISVYNGISLSAESALGLEGVLNHLPDTHETPLKMDPLVWFVLMRAMDRFEMEKDRFPGTNGVPCTIDSTDLRRRVDCLIAETKNEEFIKRSSQLIPQEAVNEICRYGSAEPHVICTMVGGAASQEVIKLVTHQYLPVDNALIFDGHSQTSKSFRV